MEIGRMFVLVGSKIDEFQRGMQTVETRTDEIKQKMGGAGQFIEQNWLKIGAATAAAGAGLEALARKQAPLTEQTRRLASATGMTEQEMRKLVTSTSDVTFSIDEVLGVMEAGRQQGLRSAEQLQEYALFWDMVSDASGEAAVNLAEAGVALRAVGIEAGEEEEALAALGFILRETTSDVGEFLYFIERTGPDLRGMNMDINDAAAIVGVLEHEFGMAGRTARQEFRRAINEANGDIDQMFRILGITNDQFREYSGLVEESADVVEEWADIHAESYTVLQRVQHWISEVAFAQGGLIEKMSSFSILLMGMGPLLRGYIAVKQLLNAEKLKSIGLTTVQTARKIALAAATAVKTGVLKAAASAQWALNAAMAANPIGLAITLAVLWTAAIVALLVKINEWREGLGALGEMVMLLVSLLGGPIGMLVAMGLVWDDMKERAVDSLNTIIEWINRLIVALNAIAPWLDIEPLTPIELPEREETAATFFGVEPQAAAAGFLGLEAVLPGLGTGLQDMQTELLQGMQDMIAAAEVDIEGTVRHHHDGVIEVRGVNGAGELQGVVDMLMDRLRVEARS